MKLRLKELLNDLNGEGFRFVIFGKNNIIISEATAECHLDTSKRLLNKEVYYWGATDIENEIVIVINKKVKVF